MYVVRYLCTVDKGELCEVPMDRCPIMEWFVDILIIYVHMCYLYILYSLLAMGDIYNVLVHPQSPSSYIRGDQNRKNTPS